MTSEGHGHEPAAGSVGVLGGANDSDHAGSSSHKNGHSNIAWSPIQKSRGEGDDKLGQLAGGGAESKRKVEGMEPLKIYNGGKKLLNLENVAEIMQEIAIEYETKSDLSIKRRLFGMGKESKLIHPYSRFARIVTSVSGIFLLYTAICTPFVLGFFWDADPCYRLPILELDMAVDSFFIFEILFTFCLGAYYGGVYVDVPMRVAYNYATGMLLFDMVTSIPVSYVEWFALQKCGTGTFDASGTRVLRLIKPFRLFRILRLIKNQKLLVIFDRIEAAMKLPPFAFKMVRLFAMIGGVVHLCSCFFYLVKVASNEPEQVNLFLMDNGIEPDADRLHKYMLAFYFINTVFTTVGFGDIGATNTSERAFVVVIMYIGTIIFGLLLAEVDTAVSYMRRFARKRGHEMQVLLDFLRSKNTPIKLEQDIMEWANFEWTTLEDVNTSREALRMVPAAHLDNLKKHLHSDRLLSVSLFASIKSTYKEQLLIDLWLMMLSQTFAASKVIIGPETINSTMYIIRSGTVRVITVDPVKRKPKSLALLMPGDSFGVYSLMGETNASREWDVDNASFVAGPTFVECQTLTKQAFADLIDNEYEKDVGNDIKRELESHMVERSKWKDDENPDRPMKLRVLATWSTIISRVLKISGAGTQWGQVSNTATNLRRVKSARQNSNSGGCKRGLLTSQDMQATKNSLLTFGSQKEHVDFNHAVQAMEEMVERMKGIETENGLLRAELTAVTEKLESAAAAATTGSADDGTGGGGGDTIAKLTAKVDALTALVTQRTSRGSGADTFELSAKLDLLLARGASGVAAYQQRSSQQAYVSSMYASSPGPSQPASSVHHPVTGLHRPFPSPSPTVPRASAWQPAGAPPSPHGWHAGGASKNALVPLAVELINLSRLSRPSDNLADVNLSHPSAPSPSPSHGERHLEPSMRPLEPSMRPIERRPGGTGNGRSAAPMSPSSGEVGPGDVGLEVSTEISRIRARSEERLKKQRGGTA